MHVLKVSLVTLIMLLTGCASSIFKMNVVRDSLVDVIATSDRFLPFCEKVIKDNGEVWYGYMIFFLDEEKTVGTATGMLTGKKTCFMWRAGAQKIIDSGSMITLSGFGSMNTPRVKDNFSYTFPQHGTFFSNGRSMDFFSIRNNHGNCFSVDPDRCL